ncbi:MAG TPA: tryptophan synthase subunit alpha [Acidothermaceae bacterium]|jgi:tryptophan synthase alpha chain|nr:tryptophan synthase subunit alpha [Acidothermaceae bacterium]
MTVLPAAAAGVPSAPATGVPSKLSETLARCKAEGRAALIGYLPACFPTPERGIAALLALVEGGVDAVEVGLPYSDPVLEGPVIARSHDVALRSGSTTAQVLRTVEAVAATGTPTVVMTYWNPVEQFGVDRFAAALAAAGGSGLITPDLLPEEAEPWIAASDAHNLDRIFVVAPSSTDSRLAMTARHCRGFIYAASVMGVTGTRAQTSSLAPTLVERIRATTLLPVGVGLGVSNADQAAEVAGYADAVIVGSAFVRQILEARGPQDEAVAVRTLAAELAVGVRRG